MRLVVIGGVAAGLSAAARARRLDPGLEITVLEKGAEISWAACGLPYYVEGRVAAREQLIRFQPEAFARERGVTVRTSLEATAIQHARRDVLTADGSRIPYDRLVIATGARSGGLELPGSRHPHVFALQTLHDAERLRTYLREQRPRHAVIAGGGYIGLEMAEVFRAYGLRVTVMTADDDLLGRQDAELTRRLAQHLERFRVELQTNSPIRDLEELRADLVLLAMGVRPHTELAAAAGVDLGRTGAIRVNERMETNLGGVYAAGDCAETVHLLTGSPAHIPLGTTANKMGRVAGANAAGRRERFAGVVGTSILRVCGLGVGITGLSAVQAKRAGFDPVSVRVTDRDRARYFRGRPTEVELVADRRTGRLLGGWVLGDDGVAGRANVMATALTRGMTVDEFSDLDLAYAPPFAPVWDPLLIAAQQLQKQL